MVETMRVEGKIPINKCNYHREGLQALRAESMEQVVRMFSPSLLPFSSPLSTCSDPSSSYHVALL